MANKRVRTEALNVTGANPAIQLNGTQVVGAPVASTITATTGTLPVANGAWTVANAATPTVAELLEGIVELRKVLYTHGLLTTI